MIFSGLGLLQVQRPPPGLASVCGLQRKISADSQRQKGATVATSRPSDTNMNRRAPFVVPSRVSVPSPKKAQRVPARFGIPPFCGVCRRRLVVKERAGLGFRPRAPLGSCPALRGAQVLEQGRMGPPRWKDCHWRWEWRWLMKLSVFLVAMTDHTRHFFVW